MATNNARQPAWGDDATADELIDLALSIPRVRIDLLDAQPIPAAYVQFLALGDADPGGGALGLIGRGVYPAYAGAASSLRDRVARYRRSVQGVRSFGERDVYLAVIPCASVGWALLAEATLIARLAPVLNGMGYGARVPGATRRQRCSAFDALFPGRPWAPQPSPIEVAAARLRVVSHLARLDPAGPRWPPLVPRADAQRSAARRAPRGATRPRRASAYCVTLPHTPASGSQRRGPS